MSISSKIGATVREQIYRRIRKEAANSLHAYKDHRNKARLADETDRPHVADWILVKVCPPHWERYITLKEAAELCYGDNDEQ